MTGLTELQTVLDTLMSSTRFELDNRSDEAMLNAIRDYARLIPFDASHNWAELFFTDDYTPEKLARLSRNGQLADGTLPPLQAFLLAMLSLLQTPRTLLNYFPAAHRDLYYRELLGLRERGAKPDRVALSFRLKPGVAEHFIAAGTLFDAGQDSHGAAVCYALDKPLLVNRSELTDLRWVRSARTQAGVAVVCYDRQKQIAWPERGRVLFDVREEMAAPIVTGRMVASALLAMPAGLRTIKLTFAAAVRRADIEVAQVSSAKGWLDLTPASVSDTTATELTFTLPASAAAITAFDQSDKVVEKAPLLKVGCLNGTPLPAITQLAVSMSGNSAVRYSTDAGVDRIDEASYPFGTLPKSGAGFNLISPDWCNAAASLELTLTPHWLDLPEQGFAALYSGYDTPPADNADFQVQCRWMGAAGDASSPLSDRPQSLFKPGAGRPEPAALKVTLPGSMRVSPAGATNPRDWPQWLRLALCDRDFGHDMYLKIADRSGVNPPYTPRMASLTVSMSTVAQAGDFAQYTLTPFGYGSPDSPDSPDSPESPADGMEEAQLYLGLTGGVPGQSLSLYWQLQSPQRLSPAWQYLNRRNQWADLDETVVDGTNGLFESGLWSAVLPLDAADHAPQMPAGRYWLRALISLPDGHPGLAACPRLSGLNGNSMTATLDAPESVDADHYRQPLPAGTITRSVTPVAAIEKVEQRWPSTDGAPAETPPQFYRRAAQRLSHRERALTWQNMASLLKERYPDVFEVVLPQVDLLSRLPAPAEQKLLVIPVNEKKDNQDSLRPMFGNAHLAGMASYLQTLASPWTSIVLVNPVYRDVAIEYDVTFNVNPRYGYRRLQELMTLRFMPWALGGEEGVVTGNTLDYYGIIAWMQCQSFVVRVNAMTLDGSNRTVHGAEDEVLVLAWTDAASDTSGGTHV